MLALHNGAFAPPMSTSDLPLSVAPMTARSAGTAASVPASPAHAHTPARRRMSICGQSLQRARAALHAHVGASCFKLEHSGVRVLISVSSSTLFRVSAEQCPPRRPAR